MKLYSWNVNGIRAAVRKGELQKFLSEYNPDIVCLQETKAEQGQATFDSPEYEEYWNSSKDKKGYSGTAIFTKITPLAVVNDIPADIAAKHGLVADGYGHSNDEGRVIAAEFDKYYVVTAYTPNAKDDLSRLPLRQQWDRAMINYCDALQKGNINLRKLQEDSGLDEVQGGGETRSKSYQAYDARASQSTTTQFAKPVLYCGDMNVAHTEDDLANPKPNRGKKGFTDEERAGFDAWLAAGFVDTFRMFTQGNGHYSWWSHFAKSRERNVGWRIDYWLVSGSIKDTVKNAEIQASQLGSDHCPVSIEFEL